VHECERVFLDRMVSEQDMTKFAEMRSTVTKKYFQDLDMAAVEEQPLIYTNFMTFNAEEEPIYLGANQFAKLKKTLEDKLEEHNESNAVMDLVLFNQAVEHVTRITRIIDLPEGNAMLVGVGGSGKQSLARLAAFICGHELFQVQITGTYGINDFKEDFLSLYQKAGVKGTPVTFLMTDNQIVQERILIYINDFLTTEEVSELFTPEDKDGFCNSVRGEVKQAGIIDTSENCWDFFINKVRKNLHLALCFSPVGDKFRIRARQFPGLVNCTVFDWFHSWPHEALVSVAARFLKDIPNIEAEVRENIAYHMAFAHQSVSDSAVKFKESLRRFCYTTPKSYLELISLYDSLLAQKRADLKVQKDRLENGVDKIAQASAHVKDLQTNLQQEQIIVEEKKSTTDALIVSIGQEKAIVDDAVENSRGDEDECSKIAEEVMAFQAECEEDLKAAEPIIQEAEAALNSLDKNSLGELKSFGSPAAEVVAVVSACMVLTSPGGKIPKDLSWNAGKKMMGDVSKFLRSLVEFDKDNTPVNCVERVEKDYLSNPNFNAEYIRSKSGAAAGLCAWVVNICKYYRIYEIVAPKRAKLDDANKKLSTANNKLKGIRAKVKELQDRVASLEDQLMKATEDKNTAIAQAAKTQNKAALADRLINGLSGENKRWGETIEKFGAMEGRLVGDSLLASAFVSYAGPFTMEYRDDLVQEKWIPDMVNRQIPMTEGAMPLDVLTSGSQVATWNQEGLPTDSLSIQNGAIMNAAARWSLMVDPQLQGVKWIINREEQNGLKIIQLSQNKYLDAVQNCIENGIPLLIENLPEDIDAVLDPVIGKQTIKRGRATLIKVVEKEVEYDPNFRLFLQTKLSNPHYKPEINAQATIVNFCVTEKGLEDQLLSLVVAKERPDLQQQAADLRSQLAQYTITIQELEDNLLFRLANSQGDILEDIELIENLEETKKTANDIQEKVEVAKETEATIATAREAYRPVASRGSLMYFLIDTLSSLDRVYHFSMANFLAILDKGIDVTPGGEDESKVPEDKKLNKKEPLEKRVELLIQTTSITLYQYVNQGLFERHKLIVATQLGIMVLRSQGKLDMSKFDFLLRGPKTLGIDNPVSDFVSDTCWATVQALREIDEFAGLSDDLVGSAKRWREWIEFERPEDEPLPGDWKRMPELDRLMIFRALRPDRLTAAMTSFVSGLLGKDYVQSVTYNLARSFEDTKPGIPTFMMEGCAKPTEFRAIVFALSYFHAALLERKKFGVGNLVGAKSGIGWNMNYPFNTGDLLCCGMCTNNYLENNTTVPWDDLRYIFGEIMYGGHIVEDWDRRLAFAYLTKYMNNDLLEGVDMFPKFHTPPTNLNQQQTLAYIEETMPAETPLAYGLHPNAEIGFKLREADAFCSSLLLLQPRQAADDASMSPEDKAKMVLDELVEKLPEPFDMEDIRSSVDEFTPYVMVAIQESERMNRLLVEMRRSLAELDLGLKGDLTMSEPMEAVMMALAEDCVPGGWGKVAYPSLRPLGAWVTDLLARVQQLVDWTADLTLPKVTWLPGLFNPQSFLTAVMQTTARRNDWPLDKTVIVTDITKKQPDQIEGPARDGAYIHGLTLEGARWDEKAGLLEDSQPKELFYSMPVIQIKAVTVDKAEQKDTYQCPVYTTEVRFRQEVFTAQLKCKGGENKWILAGVCMFLDVF
jgi:dynein heavy chain